MAFVEINEAYKQKLVKDWSSVMDVEGLNDIKNDAMKTSLAQILENTYKEMVKGGFNPVVLNEAAFDNGIDGTNGGIRGGKSNAFTTVKDTAGNVQQDWKSGDMRIPLAIIPLARRMFTQLLAHEVVGVQAMASPSGYAAAFRYTYGSGDNKGEEIIFGKFDPAFSGVEAYSAAEFPESTQGDVINALTSFGLKQIERTIDGTKVVSFTKASGMDVGDGENVSFNPGAGETNIARVNFKLEKVLVEAKTRKIGTSISMEDAEDALVSLGLDVNEAMVNILATDIKNSIDRELLQEMVIGTIGTQEKAAKAFSVWDAATADGLDQLGRLSALYTHIMLRSKKIQYNTKMGNGANWLIASSPVSALIERIGDWKMAENDVAVDGAAIAYAGTLRRGSIKVYNDALSEAPYIFLGWKGADITQTGCVYCPYVPAQILSGPDTDKFGARLMARARYGIVNSLWGTENFYQYISLKNVGNEFGTIFADTNAKTVFATL